MRYEKKYTFSSLFLDEMRDAIFDSSFIFKEAFPIRRVSSIYFDNSNFDDLNSNLSGISNRSKARLRWYSHKGNSFYDQDTEFNLEIKLRRNFLGDKIVESINLPKDIMMNPDINLINYLINNMPNKVKPYLTPSTELSLGVSYDREYYASNLFDLRCTLDSNLRYIDLSNKGSVESLFDSHSYDMEYCVIEMKYDHEAAKLIENGSIDLFPLLRSGRHSKYVVGKSLISK